MNHRPKPGVQENGAAVGAMAQDDVLTSESKPLTRRLSSAIDGESVNHHVIPRSPLGESSLQQKTMYERQQPTSIDSPQSSGIPFLLRGWLYIREGGSKFAHILIGSVLNSSGMKIFLLGQVIALLLASTGAASTTLAQECGISAPTAQSGLVYASLSLHLLVLWWRTKKTDRKRRETQEDNGRGIVLDDGGSFCGDGTWRTQDDQQKPQQHNSPEYQHTLLWTNLPLRASQWVYFFIALLDLEGNYLTVLAFKYTSFTSIELLESLAIPSAMLSSTFILGRKYHRTHFVGVAICLFGLASTLLSDFHGSVPAGDKPDDGSSNNDMVGMEDGLKTVSSYREMYPHCVLGDGIAILGATLYGLNDTLQEFAVKSFDRVEFLGMLGLCGTLVSAVQAYLTERDEVMRFVRGDTSCDAGFGYFILASYVTSLSVFYMCVSLFLVTADAALLNLSFLMSNLWALLFSVVAQRVVPPPLFFAALVLVVSGVVIYETEPLMLVLPWTSVESPVSSTAESDMDQEGREEKCLLSPKDGSTTIAGNDNSLHEVVGYGSLTGKGGQIEGVVTKR